MKKKIKVKINLDIFRGTSFYGAITLKDENGNLFLISNNDKIIFGIKRDRFNVDGEYILKKILTSDNEINGVYTFTLTPEETSLFPCQYWYDVGVQFANGDFEIVIPCSEFNVKCAITKKY